MIGAPMPGEQEFYFGGHFIYVRPGARNSRIDLEAVGAPIGFGRGFFEPGFSTKYSFTEVRIMGLAKGSA